MLKRKTRNRKTPKKKKFRKTKKVLKVVGATAIIGAIGVGGFLFLKQNHPDILQAIQNKALEVYASPKDFLLAHKMQVVGAFSGMFAAGRTALWIGKNLKWKTKSTRILATPMTVGGTYLGTLMPKTALVLAIVGYKNNRKILYRWVGKG